MNTYEIDYSAPAAKIKENSFDKYPVANIYKVKYHDFFVMHYIGSKDAPLVGDAGQLMTYAREKGLWLIPMNKRARKYFDYIIPAKYIR